MQVPSLRSSVIRPSTYQRTRSVRCSAALGKLLLYSKPDCPLCSGLESKLTAVLDRAAFVASPITGLELEVRDITTNSQWLGAYQMSVPVLAFVSSSTDEVVLPRPPPRISADRLEQHLVSALAQLEQNQ